MRGEIDRPGERATLVPTQSVGTTIYPVVHFSVRVSEAHSRIKTIIPSGGKVRLTELVNP